MELSADQGVSTVPKGEALKAALQALRTAIPELKGVLLATNEGLPIAHTLTNGLDPDRIAAMSAASSTLGRRISETISVGKLGEVSVRADEGALSTSLRQDRKRCWPYLAHKVVTPA